MATARFYAKVLAFGPSPIFHQFVAVQLGPLVDHCSGSPREITVEQLAG